MEDYLKQNMYVTRDRFRGPTAQSNWVIPKKLIACNFPSNHDVQMYKKVGVLCFVTLNEEREYKEGIRQRVVDFDACGVERVFFPIVDGCVPEKEKEFDEFVEDVSKRMENGVVCVHCFAGAGRTGIVVGCLLSYVFEEWTFNQVIHHVQAAFNCREIAGGDSPEYMHQKKFILDYMERTGRKIK